MTWGWGRAEGGGRVVAFNTGGMGERGWGGTAVAINAGRMGGGELPSSLQRVTNECD